MNTTKAFAAKALVTSAAAFLGASAFAGLLYEPGNYAAQDNLVLQLDGIRNAGALKAHDSAATAWVDLKSSRTAAIRAISSIPGRSVPATSLQDGTAGWTSDGYYFDGLTFLQMSGALTLGNTYTIQIVCDVDSDKFQTRFTASQSVAGPPTNDRELKWPGFVGSTDTDGKDYCNIYYNCGDKRVNTKMGDVNFGVYVNKAAWGNRYLTAWANGSQASLFDGAAVGAKTSKNPAVGTRTLTFGASYGSSTYGAWRRSLVGTIKAVRIYNTALTDGQLAANRALDEARFFGTVPVHAVVATAVPGLEGNEESGNYAFDAEGYTFSAPAQAVNGAEVYDCTGYTLETWDGAAWGEAASHTGTSCLLDDTSKKVRLTWQWAKAEIVAQDYTWMASPANGTWDTASLDWNSGAAWADGNNAIFGASSQTALTVPSERLVNDLTIDNVAYTFNGAGPLRVAGTITPTGAKDQHFNVPLASGNADGSLRFYSVGGDWRSAYLDSVNNLQEKTVLAGTVFLMAKGDGSFGPAPAAPAENIVIESGNPTIYGNGTVTVNANRIVKLASGAALWTGSNSPFTYKSQIVAEPDEGSDYSQDTHVKIRSNWGGLVTFDPGENRTNSFGRLFVDTRRLKLASGATVVTGPATSIGENAILYVKGNGANTGFSPERGYLLVDGGELAAPAMADGKDRYVDVGAYGQVVVQNDGKVSMADGVQWLNGLNSPGKLTVSNGGVFTVNQLRVSQSGANQSEVHLDEGGLIAVHQLRMDNDSTGLFAFNGGSLQATKENRTFCAGSAANWANVSFTVGENGAGFDLSNGVNLWWSKSLASGAGTDGGLFKKGSGILVLLSANGYNGRTVLESGRIQARADHAIPSGTTLRLGGGDAKFTAWTYETENPARATVQTISRVEGSGALDNMTASSVGGIAPSVGGTIEFQTTCALSGALEITIGEGVASALKVAAGQDISGLAVKVLNPALLDKETSYKILDAADGYTGRFDDSAMPGDWGLKYAADGVYLSYIQGLLIILR